MNEPSDPCITITIPSHLIVEVLEHPEPYGDAIVVLRNGLWTDALHQDSGWFTITNDEVLIAYLVSEGARQRT